MNDIWKAQSVEKGLLKISVLYPLEMLIHMLSDQKALGPHEFTEIVKRIGAFSEGCDYRLHRFIKLLEVLFMFDGGLAYLSPF